MNCVVAIEKGAFGLPSTMVANFTLLVKSNDRLRNSLSEIQIFYSKNLINVRLKV